LTVPNFAKWLTALWSGALITLIPRAFTLNYVDFDDPAIQARKCADICKKHGVSVKFKNRTERIMNRDNTGPCPMEQTVFGTDNIEEGVNAIMKKTGKYKK